MSIKYCVLYPQAENIHLVKDVGMIAYKLSKLFGYEASLACYDNDRYEYLNKEVKGLKLKFIEKKFNNDIVDGMMFLKKESKNIHVLQLFHITLRTVFYTFAYKFFNPKGKIFLKLDCTERLINIIKGLGKFKSKLLDIFLHKVDIIGVEQSGLYEQLKAVIFDHRDRLLLIPNGIDFEASEKYKEISIDRKENIILHVGRIGSPEKATDMLLKAISRIKEIKSLSWKVILVGPIDQEFVFYIDNFMKENEDLKQNIQFTGPVYDRQLLFDYYNRSKIFCLSSKYESFGIALLEAASFGNVIVSTNVGIAKELVSENNGAIVDCGNEEEFSESIKQLILDKDLSIYSEKTQKLCREKFDWNNIVSKLNKKISSIIEVE